MGSLDGMSLCSKESVGTAVVVGRDVGSWLGILEGIFEIVGIRDSCVEGMLLGCIDVDTICKAMGLLLGCVDGDLEDISLKEGLLDKLGMAVGSIVGSNSTSAKGSKLGNNSKMGSEVKLGSEVGCADSITLGSTKVVGAAAIVGRDVGPSIWSPEGCFDTVSLEVDSREGMLLGCVEVIRNVGLLLSSIDGFLDTDGSCDVDGSLEGTWLKEGLPDKLGMDVGSIVGAGSTSAAGFKLASCPSVGS